MSKTIQVGVKAKEVYRGYMPIDLPQHRKRNPIKPWFKVVGRPRVTMYPPQEKETYTDEPEYPPLNDVSKGGRKAMKDQLRFDWYDHLKSLPTANEKIYEINKHCSHYMAHVTNCLPVYNSLPMIQYMTNTLLVDKLPDNYDVKNETVDDESRKVVEHVKQIILDQVAMDKFHVSKRYPHFVANSVRNGIRDVHISDRFIQNVVSGLKRFLSLEANPQLLDYQFDLSPAVRSWWYHSGFESPNKKDFYKSRRDEDGNINQMIQADVSSSVNIRHTSFIEPIISRTDPLVTDTTLIDKYRFQLRDFGVGFKFAWPVTLPGFWPGESIEYDIPHTSFLSTDCLRGREARRKFGVVKPLEDIENCLTAQAILTAFNWTNGLSMNHGFTPYHEVTYPFTCQLVTTDGQDWLFNVFQLNCHTFHRDLGGIKSNNICWSSGKMRLFDDYVDGQFKGINDDVIKLVIRFLSQKTSPEYTAQLNLRPHLGTSQLEDEDYTEMKGKLRTTFEQRKNRWLLHQWKVPLWEHVYFRSRENRYRIRHMKPRWHIPKPKYPKFFE